MTRPLAKSYDITSDLTITVREDLAKTYWSSAGPPRSPKAVCAVLEEKIMAAKQHILLLEGLKNAVFVSDLAHSWNAKEGA